MNITAEDLNGNLGYKEDEVPSISEIYLNFLVGTLDVVVNAMKNLFDPVAIVKKIINKLTESFISTIKTNLYRKIDVFVSSIRNYVEETRNKDQIQTSVNEALESIVYIFDPLNSIITQIMKYANRFFDYFQEICDVALDIIKKNIFKLIDYPLGESEYEGGIEDVYSEFNMEWLINLFNSQYPEEFSKSGEATEAWDLVMLIFDTLSAAMSWLLGLTGLALIPAIAIKSTAVAVGVVFMGILSMIITIVGIVIWVKSLTLEEDDWDGKYFWKCVSGILLIFGGATCIISFFIPSPDIPISFISAILFIATAVVYVVNVIIFLIGYNNHLKDERNRIRSSSYSLENDLDYDYKVWISFVDYHHLTNEVRNIEYDYTVVDGLGDYCKPDVYIKTVLLGYNEVMDYQYIMYNCNTDQYLSLIGRSGNDWRYDTLPIYTCMNEIPISIFIVDRDDGENDEDTVDDYIDISPSKKDCNIRGATYNVSEDMLYIYEWDGELLEIEKIGDHTFKFSPNEGNHGRASITICIKVNELN